MKSVRKRIKFVAVLALAAAAVFADAQFEGLRPLAVTFAGKAEARVGHPMTPVSVAGTARRTTRRVIRRSTIYVNTLPAGCARVTISGAVVWSCGATYYQPYGNRYVVVYID
jgi:hypothetical protein